MAYLIIIPDYNIAGIINASGDDTNDVVLTLLNAVTISVVLALDKLAREQENMKYTGKYTNPNPNPLYLVPHCRCLLIL